MMESLNLTVHLTHCLLRNKLELLHWLLLTKINLAHLNRVEMSLGNEIPLPSWTFQAQKWTT